MYPAVAERIPKTGVILIFKAETYMSIFQRFICLIIGDGGLYFPKVVGIHAFG